MDRDKELIADHLPLEEVMISDIDGIDSPDNWTRTNGDETPELPPVVIEENRGFALVGNHRTVWHLRNNGRTMVKCLIVRSSVHVRPAHMLISNCTEEALLFEGLLRREIVPNRSRLADMLGYSRARITQLLNLLKLPLDIRRKVLLTDDISEFQLRQLLRVIDDDDKLHAGFITLLEKKLSGRQMALFAKSGKTVTSEDNDKAVEKAVSLNIPLDDEKSSIAELEGVFAAEEGKKVSRESGVGSDSGERDENVAISSRGVDSTPNSNPGSHSDRDKDKEIRETDLQEVLRDIGNLRDNGWRMRATEWNLTLLETEFLEGVSLMRTGLYSKAMDILSELVSDDSSHHLAWFYLGRCSNLTGSLQEAEEYLRNAISRNPENPDYIVELAIVLEKLKRHTEAEAFYRKSATLRKKAATGK